MFSQDLFKRALDFAAAAHGDQRVPGTGHPYVTHLAKVAMETIAACEADPKLDADLAIPCALLHDAILVMGKEHSQDVKQAVARLETGARNEHIAHRRVHRPWGYYESIDNGERFQVKRLMIKPGARLSLQLHRKRAEHWVVVSGEAKVTRGEEELRLGPNQSTYIPTGTKHRLENPGSEPLFVIEVQSGDYFGEDDIERFADDYRRT